MIKKETTHEYMKMKNTLCAHRQYKIAINDINALKKRCKKFFMRFYDLKKKLIY